MAAEMCPKCRELRNLKLTVSTRKAKGADGKAREIRTESFHCETCGTFVRSKDTETPARDE